jgi:hypothetical protein
MPSGDDQQGVCAGAAPALVTRDGRTVFAGSGRTPQEVLGALERGLRIDPREARLAEAWAERADGAEDASAGGVG